MRRWVFCALTIGLAILGGMSAHAEDFVVVESSVPTLSPGSTVPSGSSVTVPDKAKVVLLAASGQLVTLNGPFQGVPAAAGGGAGDSRLLTAVASLVHANQQESGSVGAVRAADVNWRPDTIKSPHDVFAIDVSDGGDSCIEDLSGVMLTRNPSAPAGNVTIHAMDGDAAATIAWPAATARVAWPAALKLVDGASYVMEPQGQDAATIATVHLLPAGPKSDMQRVTQLVEIGCTDQAKLLLGALVRASK